MKCSSCKSENVPVFDDKDVDFNDVDETYLGRYKKSAYVPFFIGTNLHRIIIRFPVEVPLCKACRKRIILDGYNKVTTN